MSAARGSWSPDRVKTELEDSLENLHWLDEPLPEPLSLTDSIAELEATVAVYDQFAVTGVDNDA